MIPQAWAVKDSADGWVICDNEMTARKLATSSSGIAKIVHLTESTPAIVLSKFDRESIAERIFAQLAAQSLATTQGTEEKKS
jgi:hypothetical protein